MKVTSRKWVIFAMMAWLASGRIAAQEPSGKPSSASSQDPILRAMLIEMERSKTKLKLENMPAPYFIDYRLVDTDEYRAEAAFGALRNALRARVRMLRVVVRVGDYKQDSYYGAGEGVVDIGPLDDDPLVLRHQLWLATDRAYKRPPRPSPPNKPSSSNSRLINRWTTSPVRPLSNPSKLSPGWILPRNPG